MTDNILQDKQLIKDAMYAFYNTQVKDLFPKNFWTDSSVKGFSTPRNFLLDMYEKTSKDDFTVADMLDEMLAEYPSYHVGNVRGLPAVKVDKTKDTLYFLAYSYLFCADSGLTLEKALETRTEQNSLRYIFFHLDYNQLFRFLAEDSGYKEIFREHNNDVNMFLGTCYSKEYIYKTSDFSEDSIGHALDVAASVFGAVDAGFVGGYILEDQYVSLEREARWTVDNLLRLPFMNSYVTEENTEPRYRKMLIPIPVERS